MAQNVIEEIGERVKSRKKELILLTRELIKIDTTNPPGYTSKIVDYIEKKVEEIDDIRIERFEYIKDKPGLIATLEFGPGPTVIYTGHLDVVPADKDKWSFDPYCGQEKDEFILGRGASDMKGGVAGLIIALNELSNFSKDLTGKVKLILVPDEETDGKAGMEYLKGRSDNCLKGDFCIMAEPSYSHHPTIGQKGTYWIELISQGDAEHGSMQPWMGKNAIREMCRVIEELSSISAMESSPNEEVEKLIEQTVNYKSKILKDRNDIDFDIGIPYRRVSFNPGYINGGSKINIVPDTCKTQIDMRVPIGVELEEVERFVENILEKFDVNYELIKKSHPNYTSHNNDFIKALVEEIKNVKKDSKPVGPVLQYASSDARTFRSLNIPTIQYGPAEMEGIHSVDERAPVKEIIDCAQVYARITVRILTQ